MNSIDEIIGQLMDSFTEEEANIFLENRGPYIITKAYYYLKDGPEKYRSNDAFDLPDKSWSILDLEDISSGCQQILLGVGFRKEHPFKNLSIRACYLLFELFHFKRINQIAYGLDNGNMLDEIKFKHIVDGKEIIYFNLVEYK